MSFKIAVGNVVQVPIKFTMKEGSVNKLFSFSLTGTRQSPDDVKNYEEQISDYVADQLFSKVVELMKDCLISHITDWTGQRLVLLDNNEPAPFSVEAFNFMLETPGLLSMVWTAYKRECASKEKN